jgi:hypothetical protein
MPTLDPSMNHGSGKHITRSIGIDGSYLMRCLVEAFI